MKILLVIYLLLITSCSNLQDRGLASLPGQDNGLFGPEWTFSAEEVIDKSDFHSRHRYIKAYYPKFLAAVKQSCGACEVDENGNVTYGSYNFKIVRDPLVIEVNASPMTIKQYGEVKQDIQTIIFDSATIAGLSPQERIGGGHIHMDIASHFEGDGLKVRNFIVDMINNPEIFLGGLGLDPLNAPPLAILSSEQIDEFEVILREYDSGEIDLEKFVEKINSDVYSKSFIPISDVGGGYYASNQSKFQLINLKHFPNTIEIRGFNPQASSEVYHKQMQLLSARVKYISKSSEPVTFVRKDLKGKVSYSVNERDIHSYKVDISDEDIFNATRKFVEDTGEDVNDFSVLFPKKLKRYLVKNTDCISSIKAFLQ